MPCSTSLALSPRSPQRAAKAGGRPAELAGGGSRPRRTSRARSLLRGDERHATRGDARTVIELDSEITVYPAREEGDRCRAVWKENGVRRQCEAATEQKLAVSLAQVSQRLTAEAPNMERTGADLIAHYLSPDRHPSSRPWSAKHADTQRRLCERFVAPIIASITCQDVKVAHMQKAVNAAPTEGEGARLRRCLSALVTIGIRDGYLTSLRLREVYWQAGNRPAAGSQGSTQGESAQFVDPRQIPADTDIARLGEGLAARAHGGLQELMANTAAYSGLRQGEIFALTIWQVFTAGRVIDVDRKVIEVSGALITGLPKGCKRRKTVYPARTPNGYPLAEKSRHESAKCRLRWKPEATHRGCSLLARGGKQRRSSNFDRRVLAPAYRAAGWRDADGNGQWTWHSLRHVFCVTALITWQLSATDVSCMAGHANVRTTLDMYVGNTAGVLDRARTATA
jgi:integrase